MSMQLIYGDFETYYDKGYTLRKLNTLEYILDPRWEMIGCSVAVGQKGPIIFLEGERAINLFRKIKRPWAFVSYNALFDASILAYKYDIHPDLLIDAMGIVRAMLLHRVRNGRVALENIATVLGLPPKGTVIHSVSGYRLRDLKNNNDLWKRYRDYAIHDTYLMREIVNKFGPLFPKQEITIMDMILKMCTKPSFNVDIDKLTIHLNNVIDAKAELLRRTNTIRAQLLSAENFATILRSFGIEPPMKQSPSDPFKQIYAFAKTDPEMEALKEHPDPDVQALISARLGIKSTLEETRTERFITIGNVTNGKMPIALKYGAAHTHRFGGEWRLNQHNLPNRVGKSKTLRESLVAPPGMIILAVDASQIEARLTAWLAGETDLLREFSLPNSDVYSWFGSQLFGYPISKKTHPIERFESKTIVLGLGYQMGSEKLYNTMITAARENNIDIDITLGQCEVWVDFYRAKFKKIKKMWYNVHSMIKDMANIRFKNRIVGELGPCIFSFQEIILPSKLKLYYDDLIQERGEWKYKWANETRKIYGGKVVENIGQALDRQAVMEAALRILKRTGFNIAHQGHDELVYVIPEKEVDTLRVVASEEMKREPLWGKGLPLDSEVKVGYNYGTLS